MASKKRKSAPPPCTVLFPRGLNIRSGPGLDHPVVRVARCGEQLTPTGGEESGWLPLKDGWCMAQYVSAPPQEPEQPRED